MAIDEAADAHIFFADWGVVANLYRDDGADLKDLSVIIDRNIDVVSDDGLGITKRTIVSFRKDQLVAFGESVKLSEGNCLVLENADGTDSTADKDRFTLWHPVTEDDALVQWYVRQVVSE